VSAVRIWVMAARVRTLPAAIAPVLVGTSLALGAGHFDPLAFVAALLGAVFIQVGTNLSNDYSDARRGADTEDRLGPVRVTAGGLVPPRQVLLATYVTFGLAVACGAYLVAVAGWGLLAVGAASILAGVLYTGGPRPYGYEGLGEVFVFLFFGIVAVAGSYFVQVQQLPWQAFVCAVPVGLLASAILVVNNIRDLETDRRAGKRTLAVRLGRERTRALYTAMIAAAFVTAPLPWVFGSMSAWLLLSWLALPMALRVVAIVRTRTDGPSLNGALAKTGATQLLFCLLYSAGILASGGIGS
jgi:1,4-dihydroxy-2-naphthoate octaprenyltransferase